jgi:hypothetical protein
MPWHRPPVCLGGPLADRDGVDELAASLRQALSPRVAYGPTSAQATPQLTSEGPTAPDVQAEVDGLMGDPHRWVVGIGQRQPAVICSGDQRIASLASTTARNLGVRTNLHGLGRAARRSAARSARWAR